MKFSGKAHQLQAIVDKLKAVVDDIEEICLVSEDGFALVSTFKEREPEEALCALASVVVENGYRAVRELDCGSMNHLLLTGDKRNLYFHGVGDAILAIILYHEVHWNEVVPAIQWCDAKIQQLG